MGWPSKDPDDYMQPSRWDVQPPRWVARMRGLPVPDPTPFWMSSCASMGGLIAGGVVGEALGRDPFPVALATSVLAQTAVDVGWRVKHRRREDEPSS